MYEAIAQLLAGLALFLYGMELMAENLKLVAGDRMRVLLARLTGRRLTALGTGAFVTAVIQSSSVTTVLVIGFITAGLMSLHQAIGVILGASIGTTITAQLIAFKITKFALLMIAVGFAVSFISRFQSLRRYGGLVFGLGLVFFGMTMMSEATGPMRENQTVRLWMQNIGLVGGVVLGAAFTAIVQSSSAAIGIIIVLAGQGLIELDAGIALTFGANVGTCITAMLASIGRPRMAVQAAFAHVFYKVVGVVIWFGLIDLMAQWVRAWSDDPARQIAHVHTIFNVANALLLLPFTGYLASLMQWLLPAPESAEAARPRYLDDSLLTSPDLALNGLQSELGHLGDRVRKVMVDLPDLIARGDRSGLDALARIDDDIDALAGSCLAFARRLAKGELEDRHVAILSRHIEAIGAFEGIADILTTNLVAAGHSRLQKQVRISDATLQRLRDFHGEVLAAFDHLLQALHDSDPLTARAVQARKADVRAVHDELERHLENRLLADAPDRVHAYSLERDIVDHLYRVFSMTRRLAKSLAKS